MTAWPTFCLLLALAPPPADLEEVKKEPDLLRRFERALELADAQTKAARQLVKDGGSRAELIKALDDVEGGVTLALQALRDTGKKASKLGSQYKKGELKSRNILRQLNDLILALAVEDRPPAEKARDQVTVIHEEFLLGVMGGK